eukprot:symbB.v1.2.019228.t1/scaffold1566.1/size111259/2
MCGSDGGWQEEVDLHLVQDPAFWLLPSSLKSQSWGKRRGPRDQAPSPLGHCTMQHVDPAQGCASCHTGHSSFTCRHLKALSQAPLMSSSGHRARQNAANAIDREAVM